MVHVEHRQSGAASLGLAADLANRFHSAVIGIAAREPVQIIYGDGFATAGKLLVMQSLLIDVATDPVGLRQREPRFIPTGRQALVARGNPSGRWLDDRQCSEFVNLARFAAHA